MTREEFNLKSKGNKPAFPPNAGWEHSEAKGLSKREYIATKALQGMLASYHLQIDVQQNDPRYNGQNFAEVMAKNSVEFADALLAELEK